LIEVEKTKQKGVLLIKPIDVFEDFRGEYIETYNKKVYKEKGIDIDFVCDDFSPTLRSVLRGIHGDEKTWKLVSCVKGKIYQVVVNCDKYSKDFGKWEAFVLSDRNRNQVLIPPKYGNCFLALKDSIYHYKQSTYYNPKSLPQFTYHYTDFDIWLPIKEPIVSERDELKE